MYVNIFESHNFNYKKNALILRTNFPNINLNTSHKPQNIKENHNYFHKTTLLIYKNKRIHSTLDQLLSKKEFRIKNDVQVIFGQSETSWAPEAVRACH